MGDNIVLDLIIAFIKGKKASDKNVTYLDKEKEYTIHNADYLLPQIIRHYNVPPNRYRLSKKAKEKWTELTLYGENINNYYHRESIECKNNGITVKMYKGAEHEGITKVLNKGDKFTYNDVFHNEHMIPINKIIKKLEELPELTYDSVSDILDKIWVCRILKEEDRAIESKYSINRSMDIDEVIKTAYKDIELVDISENSAGIK
jgi:hypothetical protein